MFNGGGHGGQGSKARPSFNLQSSHCEDLQVPTPQNHFWIFSNRLQDIGLIVSNSFLSSLDLGRGLRDMV